MFDGIKFRMFVCLSATLICLCTSYSQSLPPEFPQREDIPEVVSFFAPLFLPKIIQDVFSLKEYVSGQEFAEFKMRYSDIYAVDALFDKAMHLSWNNTYEALFISLIATMDHSKFGVQFPLIGPLIWVPLTSEFNDDFRKRVRALPKHLYPDTPPGAAGDRDKLQHFFGSAFLTYVFESREAAERIGEFIELGEDKFIVDGVLDERDLRANRQGQQFGSSLLQNKAILPSRFFQFLLVKNASPGVAAPDSGHQIDMEKK